jgi:hypothetical protein
MYLLSVYFDESTNRRLQRYIDLISEKTGNQFMTEHCVPPHMTISSIEARSVDVLTEPFLQLRGKIQSGKIIIASVGQLLPYVFYAAPVWNEYISMLSGQIYRQFGDIPETSISKYYQPGSWFPHITLAKTLTKEQMQLAFSCMQDQFQVFEATVTEIGLAKVNPHEDVERFIL